jgi:cellulose synthase (UDP-forming)
MIWILLQLYFWYWWLQPNRSDGLFQLLVNSAIFVNSTISGVWFYYFAIHAKVRKSNLLKKYRVAMIVTKTPNEPFFIAKRTIEAFKKQKYPYPYDIWIADEDPDLQTLEYASSNNIKISCRKGALDYHNQSWPRRTKCKEGNLMFFYEKYGYQNYDIVCQFDIDHVPDENYLSNVIRNFSDPTVGYVACPSINSRGSENSWYARGRMNAECCVQGFVQLGYNEHHCPISIGSHYAIRTAALKSAGGIGPELAEDYSTSAIINNAGWKGTI